MLRLIINYLRRKFKAVIVYTCVYVRVCLCACARACVLCLCVSARACLLCVCLCKIFAWPNLSFYKTFFEFSSFAKDFKLSHSNVKFVGKREYSIGCHNGLIAEWLMLMSRSTEVIGLTPTLVGPFCR